MRRHFRLRELFLVVTVFAVISFFLIGRINHYLESQCPIVVIEGENSGRVLCTQNGIDYVPLPAVFPMSADQARAYKGQVHFHLLASYYGTFTDSSDQVTLKWSRSQFLTPVEPKDEKKYTWQNSVTFKSDTNDRKKEMGNVRLTVVGCRVLPDGLRSVRGVVPSGHPYANSVNPAIVFTVKPVPETPIILKN